MDIFTQRKKERPNANGLCVAELVQQDGKRLVVKNPDAIGRIPLPGVGPVFKEFLPLCETSQACMVT